MKEIRFVVSDQRLHGIDSKIFGNFLERPSWGGEIGVEGALIPGSHKLQPEVLKRLKQMQIPVNFSPRPARYIYIEQTGRSENGGGRLTKSSSDPPSSGQVLGPGPVTIMFLPEPTTCLRPWTGGQERGGVPGHRSGPGCGLKLSLMKRAP